jgi:hypothetical protein
LLPLLLLPPPEGAKESGDIVKEREGGEAYVYLN